MNKGPEELGAVRAQIKDSIAAAIMLWDDTRPSQDVAAQFGLPPGISMIGFNSETMAAARQNPAREQIAESLRRAFSTCPVTSAFQRYLFTTALGAYDMGFPASTFITQSLGVNLREDTLGALEPSEARETERVFLVTALKRSCMYIAGMHYMPISEAEEAAMSMTEAIFLIETGFATDEGWAPKEMLRTMEDEAMPGGFARLQTAIKEVKKNIDWADEYRALYNDQALFEVDILRPITQYLDD